MPQIFTGQGTAAHQMLSKQSSIAPQHWVKTQKCTSADDLPGRRGATVVSVRALMCMWSFASSRKNRMRLRCAGPGLQLKACVKMLAASITNSAESLSITSLQKEWSDKTIHYIEFGLKSSPARRLSQCTTSAELLFPRFSPKFTSKNILNKYT